MKLWQTILFYVFMYGLTAFWSILTGIRMLIRYVRDPAKFRYIKPRPYQPEILTKDWRHAYIKLENGIRLHYVEAGERGRPLMLFMHGFPEFWYTWRHQLREFQKNYYVVAVDMRGYGGSDKPKSIRDYRMEHLVEDIQQTVTGLGYQSCVLVAHDWGGVVGWQVALRHPEIVEKLVIMNAPHVEAMRRLLYGGDLNQLLRSWYIFMFQTPYLAECLFRSDDLKMIEVMLTRPPVGCTDQNAISQEDMEAWKYTFQQPGALTPPINYYRANFSKPPDVDKERTQIVQPPTLIIWGTADKALRTELAQLSALLCRQATVRLVEGASHWVQQDRPQLCNQHMWEFLQQ